MLLTSLRILVFSFSCMIAFTEPSYATPLITCVTGPLTHSSSLTISGSGFGAKLQADPARVEIGDAPTWSGNHHREIQVPSGWSDNSITVTLNQGSFPNFNDLYLYVIDGDGNVNSNGYHLGSLCAPRNLKVE